MAATGAQALYQALINAGLSSEQAAGVLGNAQSESSFDVEANAMDSNGKRSYGFIQWNAGSYPDAGKLVTGNRANDTGAQVNYLLHNTNNIRLGLQGKTAAEVAGNFARYVEVCQGCQPGGSSYNQRVAQAQKIYQQAQSGNWGSGPGVTPGGNDPTSGNAQNTGLSNPLNPTTWLQGLADLLGVPSVKDLAVRFGLIVLGGILIIVGVAMIANQNKTAVMKVVGVSGGSGGGGETGKAAQVAAGAKAGPGGAALAAVS